MRLEAAFPRQPLLAEAIGTGVLVFAGCGAIVVDQASGGGVTPVGVALAFGLAIGIMIAAVSAVSGAHFNPAVTLALAAGGLFPRRLVLPYWAAQLAGGLAGALALRALFGAASGLGRTAPAGSWAQAFALETLLTALLVFVIAGFAMGMPGDGLLAPAAIGGTVALEALFGGPVSGASMNPARSLAPALASGQLKDIWIYLAAPLLGGLLGVWLRGLLKRPAPKVQT
jgi:aquaporin NIP